MSKDLIKKSKSVIASEIFFQIGLAKALVDRIERLEAKLEDAQDKAFCASEAHVSTMRRALTAESELAALKSQVQEPVAWNKKIRDNVDDLLAQAGFAPDCSIRNQLSCMNFDTPPPSAEDAAIVKAAIAWREDHLSDSQLCDVIDAARGEG